MTVLSGLAFALAIAILVGGAFWLRASHKRERAVIAAERAEADAAIADEWNAAQAEVERMIRHAEINAGTIEERSRARLGGLIRQTEQAQTERDAAWREAAEVKADLANAQADLAEVQDALERAQAGLPVEAKIMVEVEKIVEVAVEVPCSRSHASSSSSRSSSGSSSSSRRSSRSSSGSDFSTGVATGLATGVATGMFG